MWAEQPTGKIRCDGTIEREVRARGFRAVAGVDEVGRGALFGPVVAGAVILSPDRPVRGLNDSKLLAPERREVLAVRIRERAVARAVAAIDAATIHYVPMYHAYRASPSITILRWNCSKWWPPHDSHRAWSSGNPAGDRRGGRAFALAQPASVPVVSPAWGGPVRRVLSDGRLLPAHFSVERGLGAQ